MVTLTLDAANKGMTESNSGHIALSWSIAFVFKVIFIYPDVSCNAA